MKPNTKLVFVGISLVVAGLLLAGCATKTNLVNTETIIGLRIRTNTSTQNPTPEVAVGIIRSHTVSSPTNEQRSVATWTDAEQMGWNRTKVHTGVTIQHATPAQPPLPFDPFTNTPLP